MSWKDLGSPLRTLYEERFRLGLILELSGGIAAGKIYSNNYVGDLENVVSKAQAEVTQRYAQNSAVDPAPMTRTGADGRTYTIKPHTSDDHQSINMDVEIRRPSGALHGQTTRSIPNPAVKNPPNCSLE